MKGFAMTPQSCILIGAPVDSGKTRNGCLMGQDALRDLFGMLQRADL